MCTLSDFFGIRTGVLELDSCSSGCRLGCFLCTSGAVFMTFYGVVLSSNAFTVLAKVSDLLQMLDAGITARGKRGGEDCLLDAVNACLGLTSPRHLTRLPYMKGLFSQMEDVWLNVVNWFWQVLIMNFLGSIELLLEYVVTTVVLS